MFQEYRCIDIDDGNPHAEVDFRGISPHCGSLVAFREECSSCAAAPLYLGSNIHFSCGLEVSSFVFSEKVNGKENRLQIRYCKVFATSCEKCFSCLSRCY